LKIDPLLSGSLSRQALSETLGSHLSKVDANCRQQAYLVSTHFISTDHYRVSYRVLWPELKYFLPPPASVQKDTQINR